VTRAAITRRRAPTPACPARRSTATIRTRARWTPATCSNTVDVNIKAVCYTGDPKTKGKGICKEGITQCGSDGKPGECKGQVLPGPKELCNGVDDTCDGVTDEGCAPTQFVARMATVSLKADGKTYGTRTLVGASNVAGPSGGNQKITAEYGFLHWIKKYLLP
jgi:hypothetical protein